MRKTRGLGSHRKGLCDESGQALVEFAFVLVMMVVLVLGLVDFARLFLQYQVITDSAREGARRAVVENGLSSNDIRDVVLERLAVGGINTSGAALAASCDPPSGSVAVVTVYECRWTSNVPAADPSFGANYPVRVGVAVPFNFALVGPFLGWSTGSRSITLRTSFVMRKE